MADKEGFNCTQNPYNAILSADKLKPWIRVSDESVVSEGEETEATDSESDDNEYK